MDGDDRDKWPEMIDWLINHIIKMEAAFKAPLTEVAKVFKKTGINSGVEVNGEFTEMSGLN